ncbi:MAG: PAS domain-containing protein [Acidimicrobiales bacterium]
MTTDHAAGGLTTLAWAQATELAAAGVSFADEATLAELDATEDFDRFAFAVIEVDDGATVLGINRAAAELFGVVPDAAIGRDFFLQVVPGTNNRLFRGTFRRCVDLPQVDLLFAYTFTYRIAPTDARVHLHRRNGRNLILVRRS